MPYVPPAQLSEIPRKIRAKLQRLLYERAVMAYIFSYERLKKNLKEIGLPEEEVPEFVENCIVAFNDDQGKKARAAINDEVSGIFAENGVTSLRDEDPFGHRMDYIYMESTSTVLSKTKAIELSSKFGIDPATAAEWLDAATTRTPYTTLQARAVKEKNGEDGWK